MNPLPRPLSPLLAPLLLAALAASPGPSLAQPAPAASASPELRAQSNLAFEQGVRAFQAGRIAEALPLFRESYRLLPRPAPLYNIGQCELGLDHPVEALEAFNLYASSGGPNPINDFIKEAESKIARLKLSLDPPAASAQIDGKPASGPDLRLDPGQHLIEVSAPGYLPSTRRVTLARGDNAPLQISLEKPPSAAPSAPPSAPASAPSSPASPPPPPAYSPYTGTFWVVAGASAVFLAAGAISGTIALRNASTYNDQPGNQKDGSLRSSGETLRVVADVSFGLGIASGIGAILLARRSPPTQALRPWPTVAAGPSGAWLGLGMRY